MSEQNGRNGNGNRPSTNGNDAYRITDTAEIEIPSVSGGIVVSGGDLINEFDEFMPSYNEAYEQTEILDPHDDAQFQRIHNAIHDLLDAFNVNWDDPNYTDTPLRVAKAYTQYWASGYARRPEDEITVFPNSSGSEDLVMVKDMQFYSLCSHHLAPFKGYGAVAYMADEKLLGLSKLGRILDIYARRFQLQERIGAQTADTLMRLIEPKGVMVVLYDVEHMCMSSRGVQMHDANTTTIATRGVFKEDADLRNQVLSMLK
ncbi:MAG: GTP cyclohydrolase I [Chloroflexota bacterium]